MTPDGDALIEAAKAVRERAHAPYSHYHVGSAVLDEKGRIHIGCNVENAAYPEGICAETSAIAAMVAAGGARGGVMAAGGVRAFGSSRTGTPASSSSMTEVSRFTRQLMSSCPPRFVSGSRLRRAQRAFFERTPWRMIRDSDCSTLRK